MSGTFDFHEMREFRQKVQQLDDATREKFFEDCAKELAARLLAKVIKRTPVGVYPPGSGKVGGTLRRGWTGGKSGNATAYANAQTVTHSGHDYIITITNPTEYASYVESGHRTRNHKGWVKGQFFLRISEKELMQSAPGVLGKKIDDLLKGYLK